MSSPVININEFILNIIKDKNLQKISAIELKNLFLGAFPDTKNKQATQLVHRTLNKLCRYQFFEKTIENKKVVFFKTSLFDKNLLTTNKLSSEIVRETMLKSSDIEINELQTILNQYQIELLGKIGEAEEFKRLCNEYPAAKETLYPRYMHARNQSSTMVGKINAVEAFITSLKG